MPSRNSLGPGLSAPPNFSKPPKRSSRLRRIEYIPSDNADRHAKVNDQDRRLQRIFSNARFDHHGRLYGGFWELLPKKDRKDNIYIDAEEAVALDYGQMGVRLMYAQAEVVPSFKDAYAIPGLEAHRDGVKRLMGSMLNASKPLSRIPTDIKRLLPHVIGAGETLQGATAKVLCGLIMDFHAPISKPAQRGCSSRMATGWSWSSVALV